jgi:hypothetical protein
MIWSHRMRDLALLGEFAVGLGLNRVLDRYLPAPGSGAEYLASEHVFPIVLMLNGGGRTLEDNREIREDVGLREILSLRRMPSADATGDWLRRNGHNGGLEGLAKVNRRVVKRALKQEGEKAYTLDIDATGIASEKESAKMTYKGYTGYLPMVGHLAENGLVVGDEFLEGNDSPGSRNLEFLKYCRRQMPKGKEIRAFRADSAAYQAKVINYCQDNGIKYAIEGDLDQAVKKVIATMKEEAWRSYQNGFIGDTVHCMNETKEAFRLVVIRRPYRNNLFDDEGNGERYTIIATNRDESAEKLVTWYNQRGECSENRIK